MANSKNSIANSHDLPEENKKTDKDFISLPKSKLILAKKLLANISENCQHLADILGAGITTEEESKLIFSQATEESVEDDESMKVIEGVFDGENMIGPDGKVYTVPANYASKSKLVEGDIMKLTITGNGTFVYKQIGPIDRDRIVGVLEKNKEGNFYVTSNGKSWRVLTASVTYFKGEVGDEVVILVPKNGDSKWSAIENIVHIVQ